MRVSMSAIGSVSIPAPSPARLGHARDRALMGEVAQADAAEPELLEDRARAAAAVAARVVAHPELLRAPLLVHQSLLGHQSLLASPNGRPSACSSARAWSSVSALVVIVTSRPRTCWMSS